ncbi:hypothetical protein I552_9988 [Mycobacterium xenopi 3993]|nr:hypothetical protein I552_9988 [Mycobacterium xenopi 3993]
MGVTLCRDGCTRRARRLAGRHRRRRGHRALWGVGQSRRRRPGVRAGVGDQTVGSRAVHVAIEEGVVELDTPAGPPGSTVRHLLAHASGLAMHSDHILARPGTRRVYSNHGFTVLAETVERASGIEFGQYLTEAVFEPLQMTASRLDGGTWAAGFGATSTVADLTEFAADLLRPAVVSAQMHAEATSVQFPGLDGVLPGYGVQRPNDWAWVSRFATPSRRTGPVHPTRREPTAISGSPAALSGRSRR